MRAWRFGAGTGGRSQARRRGYCAPVTIPALIVRCSLDGLDALTDLTGLTGLTNEGSAVGISSTRQVVNASTRQPRQVVKSSSPSSRQGRQGRQGRQAQIVFYAQTVDWLTNRRGPKLALRQ